jgi:carbon storage regulator
MLVLSRKKDQKVLVRLPGTEAEIEVTVVQIDQNRVRLGFTAPAEVTILRSELNDRQKKPQPHTN